MHYKFAVVKNLGTNPKVNIGGKLFELTIFGDLLENAVPKREAQALMDFGKLFGSIDQDDIDYHPIICDLRSKIEQGKLSKMGELERLRSIYTLTYNYTFQFKDENGMIRPTRFGFIEVEPPFSQDMEREHDCIYECFSMKDGVFSILHYLFLGEYKLKRCEHCGKYFPTKTLKTKYCSRNSPFKKHENQSCSVAVDHILKAIKKRRKNILKYMSGYFPKAIPEFSSELDIALKKPKSVAQLNELRRLTSKEHVKKHWYKEKYK